MTLLSKPPLHHIQYYLTAPYPCSYLPDRWARSQVVLPAPEIDTVAFSALAHRGFRRSGHYVYRPHCDTCHACVPIRLKVNDFEPRRSQRRNLVRNQDIVQYIHPLEFNETHYRLYRNYQAARHAGGGMDTDDREQFQSFMLSSSVNSSLVEFRLDDTVVMVSLIDRLVDGLSAVYTFYDPELPKRGLGVFNILSQIKLTTDLNLPYLYLGYWIQDSPKMAYKSDYQPLEYLHNNVWRPFAERN
jgi:leucyl-tRNA---protein transferase